MSNSRGSGPAAAPFRYDAVSIFLHWLIAGLVAIIAVLGFELKSLPFPSPDYDSVHVLHASLGEVAFVAVVVTLWWRGHRPAVVAFADAPWRMFAARWTHRLLLVLLVIVPLAKIVRGAFGIGWTLFGLRLAAPWPANRTVSGLLSDAHEYGAYALLVLGAIHGAVALWRAFVLKDESLARILPRRRRRGAR